jgi:rubrerythrin
VDSSMDGDQRRHAPEQPKPMCRQCGRSIEKEHSYCPYCGQRQ